VKILAWDIEAGSLSADFGLVLCVGFKEVGKGKPFVLNILDYLGADKDIIKAERKLLIEVSAELLEADIWLTHYGSRGRFDLNFVQSRLLYHRLPILPPKFPQIDTWRISRNELRLHNNRLVTLQEFLGITNEKNAIKGDQWIRALSGHKASMSYVVEHCRRDVLVLEEVYELLKPLCMEHPNKGLIDGRGGCSICGGNRLQRRGFHITRTRKYRRLQCQDCGAWSREAKPIEKALTIP
jgi:uncharacterized protein YprB with RNaseH-like and TPR domain